MDNPIEGNKHGKPDRLVKRRKCKEYGVTRKEFHALLEKASQPIKHEAESGLEKSET